MTRALALSSLVALTVLGCASAPMSNRVQCVDDDQCAADQICFADGCGDPARDVFVEVRGTPMLGYYEQDFPVELRKLPLEINLGPPQLLKGTVQQFTDNISNPTQVGPYSEEVKVRVVGESVLIPGVQRSYETTFPRLEQGFFSMAVGAGVFTVTATPTDRAVPPLVQTDVQVMGETSSPLNYIFPSIAGAVTLTGRVVKSTDSGGNDSFVTETAMEIQAFDLTDAQPLSQRVQISSGSASSTGEFTLPINPDAKRMPAIELRVTPKDPSALVPSRSFILETPLVSGLKLTLGEFGAAVEGLAGAVLDADGNPVEGARVVFAGPTIGGGTFQSQPVTTDASGHYTVDLLAPPPGSSFTMTVVPPAGSRAAVTETSVKLKDDQGVLSLSPPDVRCFRRVKVTGVVFKPDGLPAAGVRMQAVELASSANRVLPLDMISLETDERGAYELYLDTGDWRLDWLPMGEIARSSRLLKLKPTSVLNEDPKPVEFPEFTLPRGRKITGVVNATMAARTLAPMPYAGLRFFHVGPVEGKDTAVLLGEATADSKGNYSVVLPTR